VRVVESSFTVRDQRELTEDSLIIESWVEAVTPRIFIEVISFKEDKIDSGFKKEQVDFGQNIVCFMRFWAKA